MSSISDGSPDTVPSASRPYCGCFSHHGHLGIVEPARLFQNGERDAGLADVVQHSRKRQPLTIGAGRAELLAECHGQSGDQKAMLIGLAVMRANRIDPCRKALRFDLADDRIAGRLDRIGVRRRATASCGKDAAKCVGCGYDARAAVLRKFRVFVGQRSGLAPKLGEKSPAVDGAMDDVGGADGKRARVLQPGRLFGDEDHLGILRPALELVLQLEEVRGIVEIKVEDGVLPEAENPDWIRAA